MITTDSLSIGDKLFYRNGTDADELVFVRDWTEEEEPFVLIENRGKEDWVHIFELYPWTGEEQAFIGIVFKTLAKNVFHSQRNTLIFFDFFHTYLTGDYTS